MDEQVTCSRLVYLLGKQGYIKFKTKFDINKFYDKIVQRAIDKYGKILNEEIPVAVLKKYLENGEQQIVE